MNGIHRTIEMENRIAELEAENMNLRNAVAWAAEQFEDMGKGNRAELLRSRAFPPKFEEVEVKRWVVVDKRGFESATHDFEPSKESIPENFQVVPVSGTYQRPIVAKVKRREKMEMIETSETSIEFLRSGDNRLPSKSEYFREWEE